MNSANSSQIGQGMFLTHYIWQNLARIFQKAKKTGSDEVGTRFRPAAIKIMYF